MTRTSRTREHVGNAAKVMRSEWVERPSAGWTCKGRALVEAPVGRRTAPAASSCGRCTAAGVRLALDFSRYLLRLFSWSSARRGYRISRGYYSHVAARIRISGDAMRRRRTAGRCGRLLSRLRPRRRSRATGRALSALTPAPDTVKTTHLF